MAKDSLGFCNQKKTPAQCVGLWSSVRSHAAVCLSVVKCVSLTLRVTFEQFMLCIYHFLTGLSLFNYVIDMIHSYLSNKMLYFIYSELF